MWSHEGCNCCLKPKSWYLRVTTGGTSNTWTVHSFWLALWWWILLIAVWQPVSVVNIPTSSWAVQPNFNLTQLYCTYFWNHYLKRDKNSFSGDQTITRPIPCKRTYNNASFHAYSGVRTPSHRVPQPFHPHYMYLVQIKQQAIENEAVHHMPLDWLYVFMWESIKVVIVFTKVLFWW